jgi:hypothetical protein
MVYLTLRHDTQCRIVDPGPERDIIIHQVRADFRLAGQVEQLQLTTGFTSAQQLILTKSFDRIFMSRLSVHQCQLTL